MRTIKQTWGTQLNVWDGVSVLDNRMTSSNKRSPAPGGSWDTLFLVSSSNFMLVESDQQAKSFNQGRRFFHFICCSFVVSVCFSNSFSPPGFTIEYRFVSHSETWEQSQSVKPRFDAGGTPSPTNPTNIVGAGVMAQLSPWPYLSSLFYVCPQAEALAVGAAITININQV